MPEEKRDENRIMQQLLSTKVLEERIKNMEMQQVRDRAYVDNKIFSIAWKIVVGFVIIAILFLVIYQWVYYSSGNLLAVITKIVIALEKNGITI